MNGGDHVTEVVIPVICVLLISAFVGGLVITNGDEYRLESEASEDYCQQELGENATTYNAMVVGEHGGLHCHGPNGTVIHLHDVPEEEIYAASEHTPPGQDA